MADLITLQEYKDFKGITKATEDAKISLVIAAVSSLIKTYCGQTLIDNWDTPYVEEISTPFDQQNIYLSAYPIREVISVEEIWPTGSVMAGLDSTVHFPADYTFSSQTGSLVRTGRNWSRSVRVTYTAGYATTPPDLKLAAIELVSYYLNEEWKPSRTTMGATMAGPPPSEGDFPKHIKNILDLYKVNNV